MAWIKIDDQFADHPKIIAVGPLAAWLYVCGLTYCGRYLTDGWIPRGQVRKLADVDEAMKLAEKLIEVGLWEVVDGGYQVHDYLEYNPTAVKVKATREARTEAGRKGGYRSGESKRKAKAIASAIAKEKQNCTPSPSPSPSLIPKTNTHRAFYDELITAWHNYYPKKRKYGYDTIKSKIPKVYKDKGFRENWLEALRVSCDVKALRSEKWFSFEWFIKKNTNYIKLLDGAFEFKDNPGKRPPPDSEPAKAIDSVEPTVFFGGEG